MSEMDLQEEPVSPGQGEEDYIRELKKIAKDKIQQICFVLFQLRVISTNEDIF